jgi:hypothetical protein
MRIGSGSATLAINKGKNIAKQKYIVLFPDMLPHRFPMKAALHSTNFAAGKKHFSFQRYKNKQSKYGMVRLATAGTV